jgi:hypothetical protein
MALHTRNLPTFIAQDPGSCQARIAAVVFFPPRDATGQPQQRKGRARRSLLTANGRIETVRTRWYAAGAGSDTPVDRRLDQAEAVVSVGVRELCCRLGTTGGSFVRAAENLTRAAGLKLSEEKFWQVVEAEGQAVLAAAEEEQLELDFSAAECQTLTPEGQAVSRMYVSGDGVLGPVTTQAEKDKRRATTLRRRREKGRVRGRKRGRLPAVKRAADQRYKQFYLTAFYNQEQTRRLVGVAGPGRKEGLWRLLRRDGARVRLRGARQRIGLIDGAPHLRKRMERLPLTALGLDFYHLSLHVHEARRATFGESSSAGAAWAGDVLHTVRHTGYEPFWEKLVNWRGQQRGRKRRAADGLLHYVAERREMLAYAEFERAGWNIGSGPIEATCKATTRRLKGPGMRWDMEHAEAMMALEALYQSNLWNRYWTKALWQRN